ncbi:MAG: hypothetical protein WD827_01910 [Solirubrobacterales bacterium]
MRGKASPVGLLTLAIALCVFAFSGPAAADTPDIIQPQTPENFDSGFQSGTCTADTKAEPAAEGPGLKRCSSETPELFFTTAAGHPQIGFTQYTIEHDPYTEPAPGVFFAPIPPTLAEHTIKTLRTDLPPGLTVNPEATPSRCPESSFMNVVAGKIKPACDPSTITSEQNITLVKNQPGPEQWAVIPPTFAPPVISTKIPVYNLVPKPGEPARLGFVVNEALPVFLETEVNWEDDFHESFTIKLPNTAEVSGVSTLVSRLVTNGRSGNGTYLTTPTTCFDPNEAAFESLYSTWFRAESYGAPNPTFPTGSTPVEGKPPKEPQETGEYVKQTGCETIPFDPSIAVSPGTNAIDSPAPATVEAKLPFNPTTEGGANQSQSNVRTAEVTMPAGMGLNPSGANGLVACTDAQFKKNVRTYTNECPAASDIGSVEVASPPLHEPLEGDVYVGEPKSNNPQSGELFRILIEAKSEAEGIATRLVGNVKANPVTGQLTAVLDDQQESQFFGALPKGLPQVPFESVKIHFDGSKDVLTSPPTCSPAEATGQMEPWSQPGVQKPVSTSFTISGGANCPKTLAERKFTPPYTAASDNTQAKAYSPFRVHIGRPDGQQELKVVNVTLPKGLTGKLAGIPYCAEGALTAAAAATGKAEAASPSCSTDSRIGSVSVEAGTGGNPLSLGGTAYLAGPYKGAPLSMAAITPAVAGPYDLGTVVVRAALFVNPKTAQVNAVSDPIPDVFGGVKLDLRSIDVNVDRNQFMLNPTNCTAQTSSGVINGGGANPADPAAFSSYPVSAPFQVSGCNKLGFKPKLHVRVSGPTKRAKNPRIRAILVAREGDANLSRAALNLPSSLFLDQSHIKTICTRPQLASQTCPKASVYGQAEAKSPLLSDKLKGPVYLVSSDHKLPDLVADLRGQVRVQAYGVISTKHGGLKTVFNMLPDVPVKKFILNMNGGRKSLVINSRNLCEKKQTAVLNLKGQNGKRVKRNKFRLNISACK